MDHKDPAAMVWDRLANDERFIESIGASWHVSRMTPAFQMLDDLAVHGDSRVLDVGCGPGVFYETLHLGTKERGFSFPPTVRSKQTLEYFGIDSSEEMVKEAQRRYRQIASNFLCAPIESLPTQGWDYVFCRHVLEHQQHPWQLLAELKRVCRRKLWIVFSASSETLGATVDWGAPGSDIGRASVQVDSHLGPVRYVHSLSMLLAAFTGDLQVPVSQDLQPFVFNQVAIQRLPQCEVLLCATRS